jgi:hypothetical protein
VTVKGLVGVLVIAVVLSVGIWIALDQISWQIRWRSDDHDYLTALGAFSTAVTAIMSTVAGIGVLVYVALTHRLWMESRRSNEQARRTAEAALMTQLMIEYDKRRNDVTTIRDFYRMYQTKEAALKAFRDLKEFGDQSGDRTTQVDQRVDPARFRLSRFFVRIRKLSNAGFLSRRIIWLALQRAAIQETFLDHVDPLDQVIASLNKRTGTLADRRFFQKLLNDRGKRKGRASTSGPGGQGPGGQGPGGHRGPEPAAGGR